MSCDWLLLRALFTVCLSSYMHLNHSENCRISISSVVLNVADNRPKTRYILAVDDSHNTFQEIVKAISSNLGPGKIENVPKEDALLNREISVSWTVISFMWTS